MEMILRKVVPPKRFKLTLQNAENITGSPESSLLARKKVRKVYEGEIKVEISSN